LHIQTVAIGHFHLVFPWLEPLVTPLFRISAKHSLKSFCSKLQPTEDRVNNNFEVSHERCLRVDLGRICGDQSCTLPFTHIR